MNRSPIKRKSPLHQGKSQLKRTRFVTRKTEMRTMVALCDKLWAMAVKKRDHYKCRVCETESDNLDAHHLLKRRYKATRYLLNNGVTLCRPHHHWAETQLYDFTQWRIGTIPRTEWDLLNSIAAQPFKLTPAFLEAAGHRLRAELETQ